jgi:glycine/D-amino acid oxidase-like deaminating enzyme
MQIAPAAARLGAALALGRDVPDDIAGRGLEAAQVSPARFRS